MKVAKSRERGCDGEFLRVRSFAFPMERGGRRRDPVKVEKSSNVTRSSSACRLSKADSLLELSSICKDRLATRKSLIKPVSVSFFNTNFEKKIQKPRSSSKGRRTNRNLDYLLKMNLSRPTLNSLLTTEGKDFLFEKPYKIQSREESPRKRTKIKVQAWVPQAVMFD